MMFVAELIEIFHYIIWHVKDYNHLVAYESEIKIKLSYP